MTKSKEQWTAIEAARMLANPYYTGIQVHPEFIRRNPPIDRAKFTKSWIGAAKEIIHDHSPTKFLRVLLLESLKLKPPEGNLFLSMPVHEAYAVKREPLVTEDMFVECGCLQIASGADKYLEHLLANLECPGPEMSLLCK